MNLGMKVSYLLSQGFMFLGSSLSYGPGEFSYSGLRFASRSFSRSIYVKSSEYFLNTSGYMERSCSYGTQLS